jgi:peptidylprolyl isomerase/FKBP-type peptidyl-prolyl cis-trans isomerase FkpA
VNKKYLFATIFLAIFAVIGGVAVFSGKGQSDNQLLATSTPAATIEATITPTATSSGEPIMEVDKLIILDEKVGTGSAAIAGKKVTVNYVGTLTDGTKFDSSYDHGTPFSFNLGAGEVIQGWDQGVAGMKVGGKRKLTIPSSLGYGPEGVSGRIPGGATLIFEVELLGVE